MRLASRDLPILWWRVDDDYWGYELLRARRTESLGSLPPISFALAQEHAEQSEPLRAWARTYAKMLEASTNHPIGAGQWRLSRYEGKKNNSELSLGVVQKIVNQRSNGYVQWDFGDEVYPIALRELSNPDEGRVKAWRKQARAGSLPPVLLYWISGLAAHVVLDGHDRLLAAALEGVAARALSLEPVAEPQEHLSEETQEAVLRTLASSMAAADKQRARPVGERLARAQRLLTVAHANSVLLDAFMPLNLRGRTRASPIAGGLQQWMAEVDHELRLSGVQDSALLEGLRVAPT